MRVLEHVVDRRREEPRLPAPPGRGPEHDQVDLPPLGLVDDRVADRARVDCVRMHLDVVLLAQRAGLGDRVGGCAREVGRERRLRAPARAGRCTTVIASIAGAAFLGEGDRRRDHLLADHARASSARGSSGRRTPVGSAILGSTSWNMPTRAARPGHRVDAEADGEPGGAGVARAGLVRDRARSRTRRR